jgi:hypothetical protein
MDGMALPAWLKQIRIGSDMALVAGVMLVLAILVVPLPPVLLDAALAGPDADDAPAAGLGGGSQQRISQTTHRPARFSAA